MNTDGARDMPAGEPPEDFPVHPTVMRKEVIGSLKAEGGGHLWVDATLGTAGHALALCEALQGDGRLLGIERDPDMAALAERRLRNACQTWPRWTYWIRIGTYRDIADFLQAIGPDRPKGIIADLGANYLQLTVASRGIGFQDPQAPLDGRFNPRESGPTIEDIVNTWAESEIADLLWRYGDERRSRTIAKRIVAHRQSRPIQTVGELADLIRSCFPARRAPGTPDPITRSWMALRIRVNEEFEHLEAGLRLMLEVLAPGGRLAVLTFHSGEARIVKKVFSEVAGPVTDPTNPFTLHPEQPREYRIATRKPLEPSEEEKRENPGARSAQLRVIERLPATNS